MESLTATLKHARRCSVPLVGITTSEPANTIRCAAETLNGDSPKVEWDIVRGLHGINKTGEAVVKNVVGSGDPTIGNPPEALVVCQQFPKETVVFIHNAHRFFESAIFIQALWNLRDQFKQDHRMLVLLLPGGNVPVELSNDVVILDDPLPSPEQLTEIVVSLMESAGLPISDAVEISRAVEAVQGLSAFAAEQVLAMSLRKKGIQLDELWERKRKQIEQTPGLTVFREGMKFDDIGGCENIKRFLKKLMSGKGRPNAVVFVDEIEKSFTGAQGDTSGVSMDQLRGLLTFMQDEKAEGVILVGPPGAAKSANAKAVGNEAGIPTIQLDLGAAKGSLVGQSEQQLRAALKTIKSVSNGKSFWIATCNSIGVLPPELRRRFTLGTFFFDLPDADERAAIWKIHRVKFEIDANDKLPNDDGWTGAEIETCCRLASKMGVTLAEAAEFVVPVSRSAADSINRLREQAEGRFLSASKPGVYKREELKTTVSDGRRKVSLPD